MSRSRTKTRNPKGKQRIETSPYTATDLKAIVVGDRRTTELVPAHNRLMMSFSFERWLALAERNPDASPERLRELMIEHYIADRDAFADKLTDYLKTLHDDLTVGARFMSLQHDPNAEPRRVGLRPTRDESNKIIRAFEDALAAFRRRKPAPKVDLAAFGITEMVLSWLSAQRAITVTAASNAWDAILRFRKRYRSINEALAALDRPASGDRLERDLAKQRANTNVSAPIPRDALVKYRHEGRE